jgi:cytochrome c oxidase subunit 3
MATRPAVLDEQFDSLEHQHETRTFGMWVYLVTELMLFGGLFAGYAVYRVVYPQVFADGSSHLDTNLGAINTAVLILSSLTMALAVHSAQVGHRRALLLFLILTAVFGTVFMGIKGIEYYHHYQDQLAPGIAFNYPGPLAAQVELFFVLYFAMTGLHAIHLVVGILLVAAMFVLSWRGYVSAQYWTPVELLGLYWHFVDVIWIFLFPLLYLIQPA